MERIPQHVAIIMDGNGRWAKRRSHSRIYGHVRGARRVKDIVIEASQVGVKALSVFAFSTENWNRPESEIETLWKILIKFIDKEIDALDKNNVRFKAIGQLDRLADHVKVKILQAEERLSKNTGLQLNFAISYGSRVEITDAVSKYAQDCLENKANPSELTEAVFNQYLWTHFMGEISDVDLLIRTSGENRISNFLLWQSAYAELVFLDVCWPDFRPVHLLASIKEYQSRVRRFGSILPTQEANV